MTNDHDANGLPPPKRPDPARDFIAQAVAAWDQLKQYEGPDVVHALTRLAIAQQLQKIGPLLENLASIAEDLTKLALLAETGELHAIARLTPIAGKLEVHFDLAGQAPSVTEVKDGG